MTQKQPPAAVTFLSLGPGDPRQLTLQAADCLRRADAVLLPATRSADGTTLSSRAADIITQWCPPERLHLYPLPMSTQRQQALAVYDRIHDDALLACRQGQHVVVAVEGDASVYASTHYVFDRLRRDGVPVEQMPGIPSFIAAAAMAGLSLASQEQTLTVVPGNADAQRLRSLLDGGGTVVVMKLSRCQEAVKQLLLSNPDVVCHYFENVGTDRQFHTDCRDEIMGRRMPYFSIAVLTLSTEN